MVIKSFERLTSNTNSVYLGTNMAQAAFNAANVQGSKPDAVVRYLDPVWSLLQKYDNDSSNQPYSPFGGTPNPDYIWEQPTSDGQRVAFASTTGAKFVTDGTTMSFSVFLVAFADNAMEAKIELFELMGGEQGDYVKAAPQPAGLDELVLVAGKPNMPAEGLTEIEPYNWQNICVYSTCFTVDAPENRIIKIVVSFEVTNYLVTNPPKPNPAGLQFFLDIYSDLDIE